MRTLTLSALFLATAALSVAADPVPKPIPGLKTAQDAYDKELLIAKELHSRTVKEARAEYVKALKAIQTERTKAGDLDGAIKVKEMIEEQTTAPSVDDLNPRIVPGTWAVTNFPDLSSKTYIVQADGTVQFVDAKVTRKLKPTGAGFAADFGDDKIVFFVFTNSRAYVETFAPASNFGKKPPSQMGWGSLKKK